MRISDAALRARLKAVGSRIRERGYDAYYITNVENIFYLTNYYLLQTERPVALLVTGEGEAILFAPMVEYEHPDLRTGVIEEKHYYFDYPGEVHPAKFIAERLAQLSRGRGIKAIAFDNPAGAARMWGYEGPALADLLQGLRTGVVEGLVEEMREVKDEEELALMRESAKWAARGLEIAKGLIAEGKYDWEVALEASLELSREMKRALGEGYMPLRESIPGFVGFRGQVGEYSYYPHSISAPRPFKRGDVIGIGAGPEVGGYYSELERTLVLGGPNPLAKKHFEAMLELRHAALDSIKAGQPAAEVERAVRRAAERLGIAAYLRHHVGHGIGVGAHERPFLDVGYKGPLKAGMTVTVEPGVYVKGLGGFRHSDTVLVTEDGYELLTKYPEGLDELII